VARDCSLEYLELSGGARVEAAFEFVLVRLQGQRRVAFVPGVPLTFKALRKKGNYSPLSR